MKKGFKITFVNKRKPSSWRIEMIGERQQFSNFKWEEGKPKLKCANCGVTHWKDLEVFPPKKYWNAI